MKAILATLLIAPCAATTFQPCPRPIKSPDEALGHEARHALQRWRHAPFLSNSEGICE